MRRAAVITTIALAAGVLTIGAGGRERQPVYVGVKACAVCHAGQAKGHQFSIWRASKHAQAWATLAKPEAKRIAELSGITEEPQQAAVCLGCHATAADAEDWEKEDTFHIEDGVQCEKCHGPGSEYMDGWVMKDREQAVARGLVIPTKQDCMMCHNVKGSHAAVLKTPEWDFGKAMCVVCHSVRRKHKGKK